MKEIQLTQGKVALVDDADFEWLNQWKWCCHTWKRKSYAERVEIIDGKRFVIKMHRLILGLSHGDGKLVDHEDGDGLNNQRYNVRVCDYNVNNWNRKVRHDAASPYKGVSVYRKTKWKATINFNGKQYWLGSFDCQKEAAKAYNLAAVKYHGAFAKLNQI